MLLRLFSTNFSIDYKEAVRWNKAEEKEAVGWNKAVPFRGERGSEVEQSSTLQRRKRQ